MVNYPPFRIVVFSPVLTTNCKKKIKPDILFPTTKARPEGVLNKHLTDGVVTNLGEEAVPFVTSQRATLQMCSQKE